MQKQAIEWDLSSISIFTAIKILVHEVKNAPYGGLGRVACDSNPVSRR